MLKKFLNAACRWRNDCCNVTADTSDRYEYSSCFFQAVSSRHVPAYDRFSLRSVHAWVRASRPMFHTFRQHPRVRRSRSSCPGARP